MKFLIIGILAAFLNVTSQSQWITISTGIPNVHYQGVYFVSGETGFITGTSSDKGIVMKSTSGGLHWDTIFVGNGSFYNAMFFTDLNTGYICGSNPDIIKTTNQGLNWIQQFGPTNNTLLNDIDFVDSLTGYMSGREMGVVLKTTNGGNNWFIVLGGGYPYYDIWGIDFPSKDTGYAIWNESNGPVYVAKTTNGGRFPWIHYYNQGPTYRGLSFCNNTTGWVLNSGVIFKTTIGSFLNSQSYTVTFLGTGAGDILSLNCDTVYIVKNQIICRF